MKNKQPHNKHKEIEKIINSNPDLAKKAAIYTKIYRIKKDPKLQTQFEKEPDKVLKRVGVNPYDWPEELLNNISAAGLISGLFNKMFNLFSSPKAKPQAQSEKLYSLGGTEKYTKEDLDSYFGDLYSGGDDWW